MDPKTYIKEQRPEIIYNITEGHNISLQRANQLIDDLLKLIKKLKPHRTHSRLTKQILSENSYLNSHDLRMQVDKRNPQITVKALKASIDLNIHGFESSLFSHWLVKALSQDKSYFHAHAYLAQMKNSAAGDAVYQFEHVSDDEIRELSTNTKPLKQDSTTESNDILDAIIDHFTEFKEDMIASDYNVLVNAMICYLTDKELPSPKNQIQIKGNPNKKRIGWVINSLCREMNKGIEKEFLTFAKKHISIFTEVDYDEKNYQHSNLYKYFHTNPH